MALLIKKAHETGVLPVITAKRAFVSPVIQPAGRRKNRPEMTESVEWVPPASGNQVPPVSTVSTRSRMPALMIVITTPRMTPATSALASKRKICSW